QVVGRIARERKLGADQHVGALHVRGAGRLQQAGGVAGKVADAHVQLRNSHLGGAHGCALRHCKLDARLSHGVPGRTPYFGEPASACCAPDQPPCEASARAAMAAKSAPDGAWYRRSPSSGSTASKWSKISPWIRS